MANSEVPMDVLENENFLQHAIPQMQEIIDEIGVSAKAVVKGGYTCIEFENHVEWDLQFFNDPVITIDISLQALKSHLGAIKAILATSSPVGNAGE